MKALLVEKFGVIEAVDLEEIVEAVHMAVTPFGADKTALPNHAERPCAVPRFGVAPGCRAEWVDASGIFTLLAKRALHPDLLINFALCRINVWVLKTVAKVCLESDRFVLVIFGRS